MTCAARCAQRTSGNARIRFMRKCVAYTFYAERTHPFALYIGEALRGCPRLNTLAQPADCFSMPHTQCICLYILETGAIF